MKKIILFLTTILFLYISCFSDSIEDSILKLQNGGVQDLKLIYEWGDGTTDSVPISKYKESKLNHFYEREGVYDIKIYLYGVKDGKEGKFLITTDTFNYKKENLNYSLEIKSVDETDLYKDVELEALFQLDESDIEIKSYKEDGEIKSINYHWFFDTEQDQFFEGKKINKIFNIPNGSVKPYYTVKLRVFFKYRRAGSNVWLPFETIEEKRIRVENNSKVKIIDYSKALTVIDNKVAVPFFLTFRDNAYHNDKEYYNKTNLFYKPVIYIDNKPYTAKFVDLKKNKEGEKYNKLIYMLDFDKVQFKLRYKRVKGKNIPYIPATVKISDPKGLYEKKIYIQFVKGEV